MGKIFNFWRKCARLSAQGSTPFANDWQWGIGNPAVAAIAPAILAGLTTHLGAGYMNAEHPILGPLLVALGAFVITWFIAFLFRMLKAAARLYYQEIDRANALAARNVVLETNQERLEKDEIAIRRAAIEAQEAHTAAIKAQTEEIGRRNSPLHEAIRDQQKRQINGALEHLHSEPHRRQRLLNALHREYNASHDNISPAIWAGTEPPPAEWVNQRLRELNETWQVSNGEKK